MYLGLPGGKLIAIDSPTGGLVWESNISRAKGVTDIERANDITSHPVIDDAFIYGVTTNGDIAALDRRSGKSIWTEPISSFYGMAFDGFSLFVTHDTGSVYALNKDDGEIKWRQPALKFRKIRTGTLIKDYIVFGDYEGYLHFLSIANGAILARVKLNDSQLLNNIMEIDDSLLFIMSATGDIICLKVGEQVINDKLKVENTNKLLKLINPILAKYSTNNEISIILQKKDLIIGKTELDITDEIIKVINNEVKEFKIK